MASDDRRPPGTPGGAPLDPEFVDEGRIHEWLDGQCDATTAAQFEALVHTSPAFAARVAEARGLTAAASRILTALDDVPAQVAPPVAASTLRLETRPRGPSRRVTQWSAIAAVLAVAATGVWVLQSPGSGSTELAGPTVSFDAPRGVALTAPIDAPSPVAGPDVARAEASVAEAPVATASVPTAPVAGAPGTGVARTDMSIDAASTSAAVAAAPMQAQASAEKAAAAATEERATASVESRTARLPAPTAARSLAAGAATATAATATAPTAAALAAEAPTDATTITALIPDPELAYAVHRVTCAPTCRQVATEVGRDGLVRRSDGTSARVDSLALGRLARLVDSLDLAALPATLRLEGRLCGSVGTLRESLRVRFRVNGALRQVMGLPWCTDGTHPIDVFAKAVEALARP